MKDMKNLKDCAPTCAKVGAPQSSKVGAPQSAKVGAPQSAKASQSVEESQSAKVAALREKVKENLERSPFEFNRKMWDTLGDPYSLQHIICEVVDIDKVLKDLRERVGHIFPDRFKKVDELKDNNWVFFKKLSPFAPIMCDLFAIQWNRYEIKPKAGELFKVVTSFDLYANNMTRVVFDVNRVCVEQFTSSNYMIQSIKEKKHKNAPGFIVERDAVDYSAVMLLHRTKRKDFKTWGDYNTFLALRDAWQRVRFYPIDLLTPQDLKTCDELAEKWRQILAKNKGGDADANK